MPVCTAERDMHGRTLTIRFPDGGFRRVLAGDGRGIVAADGAEQARVTLGAPTSVGGVATEVRIGNDRFRLPTQRKPAASEIGR